MGATEIGERERQERMHDEALRMQALAIGIEMAKHCGEEERQVVDWAAWAYREATGRGW